MLLEYGVHDAIAAGFDEVVVVTSDSLAPALRQIVDQRVAPRARVRYAVQRIDALPSGVTASPERTKPWGTAHALLCAAELVHGPFGVVNADDFYGARSYQLLADWAQQVSVSSRDYAVVGFTLGETLSTAGAVNRARLDVTDDDSLTGTEEMGGIRESGGALLCTAGDNSMPLSPDLLVSMNMWGFTPAIFPQLRHHFTAFLADNVTDPSAELVLADVVGELVRGGEARVRVLRGGGPWCGITHPEDRAIVTARLAELAAEGEYPSLLFG